MKKQYLNICINVSVTHLNCALLSIFRKVSFNRETKSVQRDLQFHGTLNKSKDYKRLHLPDM